MISSNKLKQACLATSSGTRKSPSDPEGLEIASALKNTPVVLSATKVRPKPGDLFKKMNMVKSKKISKLKFKMLAIYT